MHCSAFHKLSNNSKSIVYPYDNNLPKVIINPAIDLLPSHNIILPISRNCCIQQYNTQMKLYNSPKSITASNSIFNVLKKESESKSITSAKNNIEHTIEFKKAVQKYQILEKTKVLCLRCQNNVKMIECFNHRDCAYICLNCASEIFTSITQLKDWEKRYSNGNKNCYRCERLKHSKELYSYIRYSMKREQYEICNLCLYCRNVKRCEYIINKRNNRRFYNKSKMCLLNM